MQQEACKVMKEQLFPLGKVLTPNLFEAEVLSGIEIKLSLIHIQMCIRDRDVWKLTEKAMEELEEYLAEEEKGTRSEVTQVKNYIYQNYQEELSAVSYTHLECISPVCYDWPCCYMDKSQNYDTVFR